MLLIKESSKLPMLTTLVRQLRAQTERAESYLRYFWLNVSQSEGDIVTLPFLLPVRLRSLGLVMHPHLPPQVVSADSSLLQILDDCLASFLVRAAHSQC